MVSKITTLQFIVSVLCVTLPTAIGVRNSTGLEFAVAFPAAKNDATNGECIIYVTATQATDLTVTTLAGATEYQVTSLNVLDISFPPEEYRLVEGIEQKVIYISAQSEVSVALNNPTASNNMDMTLALPKYSGINKYSVVTPSGTDCDTDTTASFYNILAYEDNTMVQIFQAGESNPSEEITLNRFEAYTVRNTAVDNDLSGTRVVADKAVSVTSGNACSSSTSYSSDQIWTSLPTVEEVGTYYIIPEVFCFDQRSYRVRVLALQDNTQVEFWASDEDTTLQADEFYDLDVSGSVNEIVNCSAPCLVTQMGQGDGLHYLTVVPSIQQYVTYARFTSAALEPILFVVMNGNDVSAAEITINGDEFARTKVFGDYTWLVSSLQGYPLESVHEVVSGGNVPFYALSSACSTSSSSLGYAYNAAYMSMGEGEAPPPTNNGTETAPKYQTTMNGYFSSTSGADFTQECTIQYSIEMNNRAVSMISQVNQEIGSTLCTSHTRDEIDIETASSTLQTTDDQGITTLFFLMELKSPSLTPLQVHICGSEVTEYLLYHSNWTNPILPPISGCPEVIFSSNMFNRTGTKWVCTSTMPEQLPASAGELYYVLTHNGTFSTEDGSDITNECSLGYTSDFQSSTYSQYETVRGQIQTGSICANSREVMLESVSTNLPYQGSQAQTFQYYLFTLGNDTTVTELKTCVAEVSQQLQLHDNWTPPIIEAPGGCPPVQFNPERFDEYSEEWECT